MARLSFQTRLLAARPFPLPLFVFALLPRSILHLPFIFLQGFAVEILLLCFPFFFPLIFIFIRVFPQVWSLRQLVSYFRF